jgi:hypothetical protein
MNALIDKDKAHFPWSDASPEDKAWYAEWAAKNLDAEVMAGVVRDISEQMEKFKEE